jgi:hypothetical protein
MDRTTHPDKAVVRAYLRGRIEQQRTREHKPPASPDRIREQLGWFLLPNNRER